MDHSAYFGYIDDSHRFLLNLPKENYTIFDIGSNIGTTTLPFAKILSKGIVYSFEPGINNYKRILKNVNLNPDLKNIKLFNIGFGEKKGSVRLYKVDINNPGMNRILPKNEQNQYDFENIAIETLDDFVNQNSIDKIELIKIDVEGYELNILKGGLKVLETFKPTLFIELDDKNLRANDGSAREVISLLAKKNYECFKAISNELVHDNFDFKNCHFDIFCKQKSK